MSAVLVSLNDAGRRIGESHPRARLSDEEVLLMIGLRESGMTYREIASKFGSSYSGVRSICIGRTRGQWCSMTKPIRRRHGSPRKPILQRRRVSLSLSLDEYKQLMRLGRGCLTRGIRTALQYVLT